MLERIAVRMDQVSNRHWRVSYSHGFFHFFLFEEYDEAADVMAGVYDERYYHRCSF